MSNTKDFFEELEKAGILVNENQKKAIREKLNSILTYEPRIGVFGKTGVGKSSLCNALFGKDICAISDIEACTRDAKDILLNIDGGKGIKLIDVPGVGESCQRDIEYGELYSKLLPELDLVLWLIKADDRAMASDEKFYKEIVRPHIDQKKPFFFVLNQVDKIEPFREWNEYKHEPGPQQFLNIHRKSDDVAAFFGVAASVIIPVSANEKYNLTKLVDEIIYALPNEKKITVFSQVDKRFQSLAAEEHVKKSLWEVVGDTVGSVVEKTGEVVVTLLDKGMDMINDWLDKLPFGGLGHGGCYITTAVCEFYGKPDDCHELTQFRRFRDEWLVKQKGGKELIERYYKEAPSVVKRIDSREDRADIYKELNNNYIIPCVKCIDNQRFKDCKALYLEMLDKMKAVL